MVPAQGRELSHHIVGIDRAGRVVGGDQHHRRHALHQSFGPAGVGNEAILHQGGQGTGLQPEHVAGHLVVVVPGCRQQHGGAPRYQGQQRSEERLVAAGGDHHPARRGSGFARKSLAQCDVARDEAISGAERIGGRLAELPQQFRMRWIAGDGLAQIDQFSPSAAIVAPPGLHCGDRRAGGVFDERIYSFTLCGRRRPRQ